MTDPDQTPPAPNDLPDALTSPAEVASAARSCLVILIIVAALVVIACVVVGVSLIV